MALQNDTAVEPLALYLCSYARLTGGNGVHEYLKTG